MRSRPYSSAAGLIAGVMLTAGGAAARPGPETSALHKIAIDARGPLALVEVTRALSFDGCDAALEMALPDGGVLVAAEVKDGGRWRPVEAPDERAAERFDRERLARRNDCAAEANLDLPDSATSARLRLAAGAGPRAPVTARYRFAVAPTFAGGRYHLRFPAAPERIPVPADVTVQTRDATDVEIAGARGGPASASPASASSTSGHASTRSGWEVSWAPRDPAPAETPSLAARLAVTPISPTETAIAYDLRGRAVRPLAPPASVLFLIDRSRSVGLPGLSGERDLARRLLETLPPSTRFDALFFDRGIKRLFPLARPATREAIDALDAEMVPDRLQNGTDLAVALREAGALIRREQPPGGTGAGKLLLAIITDGALPDQQDAATLDRALGPLPGLDVAVAAFVVRPADDDPVTPQARRSIHGLAGLRGGIARELRTGDVADGVPAALADLDHGGDIGAVRLSLDGRARPVVDGLAPGSALAGVLVVPGRPPRSLTVDAMVRGQQIVVAAGRSAPAPAWLRPWGAAPAGTPRTRLLLGADLVALLEPIAHPAAASEPLVKGSMDRMVIRNVLSLAYMPRARACYLGRTGATPALRDLTGKVRLAIDVVRGEVERASIESSTLNQTKVEECLREGAFAIEVPRAVRSDAPVTAVLNLNFRPRTPEKHGPDLGAVGEQIDLIIEGAHEPAGGSAAATSPSTVPTR